MKGYRIITSVILIFLSISSFSQVAFEEGYFIDESGKRTDCLIKNTGQYENPRGFDYKLTGSDDIKTRTISDTKEFGIGEELKFERYLVEVDLSSDEVAELSEQRNPTFEEKTVFLRKIIEGEFNLYDYIEGNIRKFFVSNAEVAPIQLVYRRFMVDEVTLAVNSKYRGQLDYLFNCEDKIPTAKLSYTNAGMIGYVKKVYECRNSTYKLYTKTTEFIFNVRAKLGYRLSNMKIKTQRASKDITEEFDPSGGLVFGVEAEYVLPFLKNRLSVPINLSYHFSSFEKSGLEFYPIDDHTYFLDYSSLEVHAAVRYNYFLNQKTQLGFSAGMAFDILINDTNKLEIPNSTGVGTVVDPFFEIRTASNFVLGVNMKYDKFFAEVSYGLSRNLSNFEALWNSKYTYLNFMVGYTIFSTTKD